MDSAFGIAVVTVMVRRALGVYRLDDLALEAARLDPADPTDPADPQVRARGRELVSRRA